MRAEHLRLRFFSVAYVQPCMVRLVRLLDAHPSRSSIVQHPHHALTYSPRIYETRFSSASGRGSALHHKSALRRGSPAKPNSKVAGVQIGLNVPYSFANAIMSGDDILKNCVELGLSGVELRTQPVEAFLGLPPVEKPQDKAESAQQVREWRKTVSMDRGEGFPRQVRERREC